MKSNQTRMHRTLIRVESVRPDCVFVVIPGWSPTKIVQVAPNVFGKVEPRSGLYLLGMVNIGSPTAAGLCLSDIELAPEGADL